MHEVCAQAVPLQLCEHVPRVLAVVATRRRAGQDPVLQPALQERPSVLQALLQGHLPQGALPEPGTVRRVCYCEMQVQDAC